MLAAVLEPVPPGARKEATEQAMILKALGLLELQAERQAPKQNRSEQRLANDLALLESANQFDRAGVHWSAHPNSYPEELKRLENTYGPMGHLARVSERAAGLCRRRLALAQKAHEFIKDRNHRCDHRKQVINKSQLKQSAELLFRQVELAVIQQKIKNAEELLEMAIELDPRPEYKAMFKRLR